MANRPDGNTTMLTFKEEQNEITVLENIPWVMKGGALYKDSF